MTDTAQRTEVRSAMANGMPNETITVDEIIERYRGQWILMRITEDDEDGWPKRGFLLERASTQQEILAAFERWIHLAKDGNPWPFETFLAEPMITSGPEYTAAVAEFVAGLIRAAGEHDARAGR